ncbi:uncharacterized protein LOC121871730 [Homarus americanus]|uniref:uncharacterized protein LOC121871730 n=1 Tax=Homarus americanus TaxID=6706 RepID=UPI001C491919|nr:uncharacterized protein LOC121871730 [Homarus americanus]
MWMCEDVADVDTVKTQTVQNDNSERLSLYSGTLADVFMMSVRHIDYLKIYPSKLLVVEIRPVRCVIDTPSGPSRTAKWMNYSHWKELQTLLNDAVDQYQEEKNNLSVTQDIECNKPIIKVGSTIKIGYVESS